MKGILRVTGDGSGVAPTAGKETVCFLPSSILYRKLRKRWGEVNIYQRGNNWLWLRDSYQKQCSRCFQNQTMIMLTLLPYFTVQDRQKKGTIFSLENAHSLLRTCQLWGKRLCPDRCGSVDWALSHRAEGHQFYSRSGHMLGLQVPSQAEAIHVSLPLFLLPSPHSKYK